MSIINVDRLIVDLSLAAEYASRAGLLTDSATIGRLRAAQETAVSSSPDIFVLTAALQELLLLMAPLSLADLANGRDPFAIDNQRKTAKITFFLASSAIILLVLIGWFMQALRVEQGALSALNKIQSVHPQMKLVALRKMAQNDEPLKKPSALYDDYQQRLQELRELAVDVYTTYSDALTAYNYPMFPFEGLSIASLKALGSDPPSATSAASEPPSLAPSGSSGPELQNSDDHGKAREVRTPAPNDPDSACRTASGIASVREAVPLYPEWLQNLLADSKNDFCFKLKVFESNGDIFNPAFGATDFLTKINSKVSLRVSWFLPFLYGLLGSVVFMIRNAGNVRAPTMDWFPIALRLLLGGVAGIVVGWFSSSAATLETTSSLSLPFALAFLTGYSIDSLFLLLDKANKAAGAMSK